MPNRYANLTPSAKISQEYTKITEGFDKVQQEMDQQIAKSNDLQSQITNERQQRIAADNAHKNDTKAHPAEHITYSGKVSGASNIKQAADRLSDRIDNIVAQGGSDNTEVVDARQSAVKGITYPVLDARLEAIEQDVKNVMQPEYSTPTEVTASVISLPSTAQTGELRARVRGNTFTNQFRNGNFASGTTGWGVNFAQLAVANNECILTITTINQAVGIYQFGVNIPSGNKFYTAAEIKPKYNGAVRLGEQGRQSIISSVIPGVWNRVSAVSTRAETNTAMTIYHDTTKNYVVGDTFSIRNAMIIDLTATFGAGHEPTKDQCDAMFAHWFDGTTSTGAIRIKSVNTPFEPYTETVAYLPDVSEENWQEVELLQSHPSGTVYIEPIIKVTKPYSNGITVDMPIQSIESIAKLDGETRTPVNVSAATIAQNKLSLTISGAEEGDVYEIIYAYPPELTTLPTLEYSYPLNVAGQIDSNTKQIAKVDRRVEDWIRYQNAVNLLFDLRITALEP